LPGRDFNAGWRQADVERVDIRIVWERRVFEKDVALARREDADAP
jgi:hypothetical protein